MSKTDNLIDLFECLSRLDWKGVVEAGNLIAEKESKSRHDVAANRIRHALDIYQRSIQQSSQEMMTSFTGGESSLDFLQKVSEDRLENIILPTHLTDELDIFYSEWANEAKLALNGVTPRNTIILSGPPGCGKTLLAKHIAKKLGKPLYIVRFDSLISSFLGETAANIRKIFEFGSNNNCVLFLDEIDAIAKARSDSSELGELKRVVISLLQNMDSSGKRVLLIAATNHPQLLDPAIWRRFEVHWKLKSFGNKETKYLLKESGFEIKDSLYEILYKSIHSMSGSELRALVNNARRKMILQEIGAEEALFLSSIEQLKKNYQLTLTEENEQKILYAFHGLKISGGKKYTYSLLEDLTGIPHSTIHHKLKNLELSAN